ncbi:MAG TPA: PAS domain-containing protein [Polyangium sp.]|nr:PAS domain-containing protein [Polyangium sp.]
MGDFDKHTTAQEEIDTLRKELAAAKSHISSLKSTVARAEQRFESFTSTLPGISWETWGRPDEVPASYVSSLVEAWTGYPVQRWHDVPGFWLELVHPDDRDAARREIVELAASLANQGLQEYRWVSQDEKIMWIQVRLSIVRDESGTAMVWQAFALDITAQKLAEIERDILLANQAQLLSRLSTPLIPVSDDVMVMPLIGPVDRARANRVHEVLLAGISSHHTRVAILDVTGVSTIDEDVVHALLRAARATRLLGVDVLLTGIRAEVAQAFCTYGQDLLAMNTCANLKQGIARAMKYSRAKR